MRIFQVIEFYDNSGDIIVAKVPQEGSAAIVAGSQLVVQENQLAFFFRDGKALDAFGPGRHTGVKQHPYFGRVAGNTFRQQIALPLPCLLRRHPCVHQPGVGHDFPNHLPRL